MARKVEADVEINDQSSKGLAAFLAGLRKADDKVKSTRKGIDETTKSTSKLSKEAEANAKAFQKLSGELEVSKKELGNLAKAFADAGTAAERIDISKAMSKQQAEIRKLTKNSDILKDLLPSEPEVNERVKSIDQLKTHIAGLKTAFLSAGTVEGRSFLSKAIKDAEGELGDLTKIAGEVAPSFGKQFSESFSGIGEAAGPALAIGIAGAAPGIAAVISGAVVGAVGVGGIAGGLALAAKDPQVEAAGRGFAQRLGNRLTDAAKPFVPVAIDGLHQIEQAADQINFEGLFSDAAKESGPLISGIAQGVEALGRGITDLIHNAGPEVAAIGTGIAQIGQAIGGGLAELSENGKTGGQALTQLFDVVAAGTGAVFQLLNVLTKFYGVLQSLGGSKIQSITEGVLNLGAGVTAAGNSIVAQAIGTDKATDSIDQYGQKILTAGDALATFTDKVDALASSGRSLFDSTTQVGEAIDNVTAAAKKNGKTLDANTEKGRNNRAALSDLAGALVANYDAYVQVNGEGVKSNAIAAENREKFIKLATAFTGSSTKAAALATQMGLIPAKKNTDFTANTHDAAARIKALQEQVNNLRGKSIEIAVSTNVASVKAKVQNTLARLGGGFDASEHFGFAAAGGGLQRTGGPLPVDAFSANVTSNLYLDGRLIYQDTARQVRAASKRDAWRQKVGRR